MDVSPLYNAARGVKVPPQRHYGFGKPAGSRSPEKQLCQRFAKEGEKQGQQGGKDRHEKAPDRLGVERPDRKGGSQVMEFLQLLDLFHPSANFILEGPVVLAIRDLRIEPVADEGDRRDAADG